VLIGKWARGAHARALTSLIPRLGDLLISVERQSRPLVDKERAVALGGGFYSGQLWEPWKSGPKNDHGASDNAEQGNDANGFARSHEGRPILNHTGQPETSAFGFLVRSMRNCVRVRTFVGRAQELEIQ
jgi:hypothetical protein